LETNLLILGFSFVMWVYSEAVVAVTHLYGDTKADLDRIRLQNNSGLHYCGIFLLIGILSYIYIKFYFQCLINIMTTFVLRKNLF